MDKYLKFFEYEHLPPELQVVSKNFYVVAVYLIRVAKANAPDNYTATWQLEIALQKLLESKDCAVRACLK